MRYDESMTAVVATPAEIAAAVTARGLALGVLAPAWLTQDVPVADASSALPHDGAVLLEAALHALADPGKTAVAHAMVADTLIRRMTLAWDRERDLVAMAGFGADGIALTVMPPEQFFAFLAGSVGLAGPMTASLYRPSMSGRALVALLGCADALRAAAMRATLSHTAPSGSVSGEEVAQALADVAAGDVRWLLPFLAEVLPFDVGKALQAAEVESALSALSEAGAVTVLESEGGSPTIIEPTDACGDFFDGLLHESARLAVTLFEVEADQTRWETVLLIRSPDGLWLADLTARQASLAGLARTEAESLMRSIAGLPHDEPASEPEVPRVAAATPEPATRALMCPACGYANGSADGFCRGCGATLA